MNSRVKIPLLTKWSPIFRAKLRKKLGADKALPVPERPSTESLKQLGFGLSALSGKPRRLAGAAARERRFFQHEFRLLGQDWPVVPGKIDWKAASWRSVSGDIKVPWELSRFQGLAEMAYLALGEKNRIRHLQGEFFAQLRDFSREIPAGTSVHWECAMDVAIRASNLIVAAELIRSEVGTFREEENIFLAGFFRQHGRFIFRNLEWYRIGRGNHYLANLAGLLACSLWLGKDRETSEWYEFAASELFSEANRQFLPDGSNFEGSVFYHRLSLEILGFCYSLLLGPARQWKGMLSIDEQELTRLKLVISRGLNFLENMTDQSGHGVQFGDHDSGRLFKIEVPEIELNGRLIEDSLETSDTLSMDRLLGGERVGALGDLFFWLAGDNGKPSMTPDRLMSSLKFGVTDISVPPGAEVHGFSIPRRENSKLEFGYYPDFGVYYWKHGPLEAWIRCGKPSGDGHGGHAHFDQLHLEIRVNGIPIIFDPGSLTYSGNPSLRNQFRGPESHFIPRLPNLENLADNSVDLFRYPGLPEGECLFANAETFVGRYKLGDQFAYRKVQFEADKIRVWDWSSGDTVVSKLPDLKTVSWGYGESVSWPLRFGERKAGS